MLTDNNLIPKAKKGKVASDINSYLLIHTTYSYTLQTLIVL